MYFFSQRHAAYTCVSIRHFLSAGVYFQYRAILLVARVPLFNRQGGQNLRRQEKKKKKIVETVGEERATPNVHLLSTEKAPPRRDV